MCRMPRVAIGSLVLSGLFALIAVFACAEPAWATGNSPSDTPVPVVLDSVEEWTAGNGLLYWAYHCYADEFVSTAALKRLPTGGGVQTTLESIDDAGRCITYQNLVTSADGLTYWDHSEGRIERMPLAPPYIPQVIKNLSGSEVPGPGRSFVEADDHLYWIHPGGKIYRTLRNGSGPIETVADTGAAPADLLVVGSTLYWIDSTGVWTIGIACGALPCADTKSEFAAFGNNVRGYGLLYRPGGGVLMSYSIYWVQQETSGSTTNYAIKSRTCNQVSVCIVVPPRTFYTAAPNWLIGPPVNAGGNLYWTERDIGTVVNNTGDLKRRALTAGIGDPTDTLATNQPNIDRLLFIAGDTIFFARRNTGIYTLPLNTAPITRDFEAGGLEATQAIQNLANAVPLATGKTTYVRGYARQLSGPNTPNVEARLIGTRNGSPLPGSPLLPIEGARALASGAGFDRARATDSWTFLLPPAWTSAGQTSLTLEVDGRLLHNDPNRANNQLTQSVTFQDQPPVCVRTVPVRTHTPLPSTGDPNFWPMIDQFERRWPVPDVWIFRDTEPVEELEVCWWGPIPHPCYGPYELSDGWSLTNGIPDRDKVITSLWTRALLSFNPDACDDIGAPVHFMGMVHPDADNGGAAGYASTISKQSWVQLPAHVPNPAPAGWNLLREGSTMAQELAHNYGRKHVDCGGPDNIDSGYPYPPCQIGQSGATSHYGYDVTTRQPIRPDQTADFMSYAQRSWVSDYTWRALLNKFGQTAAAYAALTAENDAASEGDSVLVTGLVDMENARGEIGTLLVLPTASVPPDTRRQLAVHGASASHGSQPTAVYTLRLLDGAATTLADRTLMLLPMDDHADGHSALFSDLFPAPAGAVATVQLLADGVVIDERSPGRAAPALTVQPILPGVAISNSLTIQWLAADPDPDDRLTFTVQYSPDAGSSWQTILTDYPSTPDDAYTLPLDDLGSLPGSVPDGARIRVLAGDGYNTTIATSAPFTLLNRTPDAAILFPQPGETLPAGQAVILRGAATDAEDGGLPSPALVWTIDGEPAGAGADLPVAGLAPGSHTVQLSATDSNANTGRATVTFAVAPLDVPPVDTEPVLDGFCDDEPYASGRYIQLQPYGDGTYGSLRLLHTEEALWACFSGLAKGAASPAARVGLRIDADHSRDSQAQTDDYGFFAGEDGAVIMSAGDGAGGFNGGGPGGLTARVSAGATTWRAELRIDRAVLGGWDHAIGLAAGHFGLTFRGDDYGWPYAASDTVPAGWATTFLGVLPEIAFLDPYTAVAGSPPLTVQIGGRGLISGTIALWNGNPLATTFVDAEHLTIELGPGQLGTPDMARIALRSPANAISNARQFVVTGVAPRITSLTPDRIDAGSPGVTLTVSGADFAPDARVFWNGALLPSEYVDNSRVIAQISPDLLRLGRPAGVTVGNPTPSMRLSNGMAFDVIPGGESMDEFDLYLPLVMRP